MSAVSVSQSGVRPILADAVDVARRALLELEPTGVGAHLGVTAEDETAATHRFEATLAGYRGWQWAVVVAAPPDAQYATVSESALLPGPDALVAPDFVPWEQRIRPGDLAPGDLLAPPADDPRLVPGYVASGDPAVDEVALEIGLGRTKVLSREGREEAAERWYSEYGPETDMAKAAPATCGSCGFYLPLAGALRAAFGVCGNAMGADGHVVHAEYGCGAHSDVEVPTGGGSPLYEAFDDAAFDVISMEPRKSAQAAPDAVTETAPDISDAAEPTTGEPEDRGVSEATGAASGVVATGSMESTAGVAGDVAEPDAPVAHDISVRGADTSDAAAAEPTTDEPRDRAVSGATGVATGSVESTAGVAGDVAEPDALVAHDVSVPGAGSEANTAPVEDLTDAVAESTSVEPGVGALSAVESDTADLPGDSAAEPGTSGEPEIVVQSVPDMSSAAATFSPAADVVAEPSAVIEPAADTSDVDAESISGVVSESDAVQVPADSTTDPSATRVAEPNSEAGENAAFEAAPTADSTIVPTSAEPSVEAAVWEPGSSSETALTDPSAEAAGADGEADSADSASVDSASVDINGGLVDSATSGAVHADTAAGGADVGVAGVVRPDSEAVSAGGAAVGGADVGVAGVVRPDSEAVSAGGAAVGGADVGVAGVVHPDSETVSAGGPAADARDVGGAAHAHSETAGIDDQAISADSAGVDADGGDGGAAVVRDRSGGVDGAAADDDGGHADSHGGATGTHGDSGDAAGGGPGAAARPEFGSSLQG